MTTTGTASPTPGFGIELLGLPGSGKSTLAQHFVAGTRQSGLVMDTFREAGRRAMRQRLRRSHAPYRALLAFAAGAALVRSVYPVTKYEIGAYNRFCILFPELTHAAFRAISAHADDPIRRDKAGKLWFKHCTRFQLIREEQGDARHVVAPEGFLQKALSLFGYSAESTAELEPYLATAPLPAAVAILRVDVAEAARRLAERPRQAPYPLSTMDLDTLYRVLADWSKLQERMVAYAASHGVTVIAIPSDKDAATGASTLMDQLPEHVLHSSTGGSQP